MSHPKLYGRLGTRADVDRRIVEAKRLISVGFVIKLTEDTSARTVKIENGEEKMFLALCKDGHVWLCMYNPDYYPKP